MERILELPIIYLTTENHVSTRTKNSMRNILFMQMSFNQNGKYLTAEIYLYGLSEPWKLELRNLMSFVA